MTVFLGRIAGTALGLLAGPVGGVFGFLAGWLVDQLRATGTEDGRMAAFLRDPRRERRRDRADRSAVAAVAALVLGADGIVRQVQAEFVLTQPWPVPVAGRRARVRRTAQRRRDLLNAALRLRHRIDPLRLRPIVASWPAAAQERLLSFLVALACHDEMGMSDGERRILGEIAVLLDHADATVADLEARYGGLEREACRILGVEPTADEAAIRRAFRTLAAQTHPDTATSLDPAQQREIEGAFVRIRDAHDRLMAQLRARRTYPER